jgi:uncharacterized protein with GYD domain
MPIYIMFSKLTEEGRRTVKKNPERIKEVDKEIERMGAKVLAQYAVLGKYDFINILEAPNNEAIARVSIELGSRGTIQIVTMPAIPVFEFIEKMEVFEQNDKGSSEEDIPDAYQEKMQGS